MLRLYVHATPFEDSYYEERTAKLLGYTKENLEHQVRSLCEISNGISQNLPKIQESLASFYPSYSEEIIKPLKEVVYYILSGQNALPKYPTTPLKSKRWKILDVALRNEEKTLRADINFRIAAMQRNTIRIDLDLRISHIEQYLAGLGLEDNNANQSFREPFSPLANQPEVEYFSPAKRSESYDDLYAMSTRTIIDELQVDQL